MSMPSRIAALAALPCLIAVAASADVPKVVADITPVQSLVSRVMEGVATPSVIVQSGASPHSYALSPSEARALQEADVVFWVGAPLEPWLETALPSLAPGADTVALLDAPGTVTLPFRTGATFEVDDDGDQDAAFDPHAWLDPENGKTWLGAIAAELSRVDPDNAAIYEANAAVGTAEIDAAATYVRETLAPVRGMKFVVFHDAYQYFERRFEFPASGAISLGDASAPSPARIGALRDMAAKLGVTCAFSEPEFNPDLVDAVFGGTGAHAGVIDPLGSALASGPDFYPRLLRSVADELAACM